MASPGSPSRLPALRSAGAPRDQIRTKRGLTPCNRGRLSSSGSPSLTSRDALEELDGLLSEDARSLPEGRHPLGQEDEDALHNADQDPVKLADLSVWK